MGIFDGVLLASDYDGTLRGSTLQVLDRDKRAIEQFQQEGGAFILTTGRCYAAFYQQAEELPLRFPTLLSNGATFCEMNTGRTIFNHNLPERAPDDLRFVAEHFPDVAMETYYGEEVYCYHPNAFTDWHMSLVNTSYTEADLKEMPTPWLKVLFEGVHAELEEVQKMILDLWGDYYECIFSNRNLLELTGKNVHKGFGVLEAARLLKIDRKNIYCVGDNDNDLPMLRIARIGFAPKGSVASAHENLQIVRDADNGCLENVIQLLHWRYEG